MPSTEHAPGTFARTFRHPPYPRLAFLAFACAYVLIPAAPAQNTPDPTLDGTTAVPATLSADDLFRDARAAAARRDSPRALELFREASELRPDDATLLDKISRQLSDLAETVPTTAEKRQLCQESLHYAERAATLQPDHAAHLLSVAIGHGKLGLLSPTREKIEHSRKMRDHAERALALDPNHAYAHHLLGRWHYEVATLSAGKRLLVELIYGGLPEASTAAAVQHLQRAVELEPDSTSHHVELGFALLADGHRDAARETFLHALTLPERERYDTTARRRARQALERLRDPEPAQP